MDYDVVIATRNRPRMLEVSIPLILAQRRPPRRLIVVDASDADVREGVRRSVTGAVANTGVCLKILQSKPNSAQQRNVGLKYVESPVVMFPDDDSLWWPGVAEAVMKIYECDANGDIGGVCAADAQKPPQLQIAHKLGNKPDFAEMCGYTMRSSKSIQRWFGRYRDRIERRFWPTALQICGRSCWNERSVPEWLSEEDAVLVEYMVGYRMSFRTDVIRQRGFDKDLGAYIGWAACEDTEASFHVMQSRLVVGARRAKVYHHRYPDRRADGFKFGFIFPFNYAYVVCRYSQPGSIARRVVKRWIIRKAIRYSLSSWTAYGRDCFLGTIAALKSLNVLLNTSAGDLRQRYLQTCKRVLKAPGRVSETGDTS